MARVLSIEEEAIKKAQAQRAAGSTASSSSQQRTPTQQRTTMTIPDHSQPPRKSSHVRLFALGTFSLLS